MIYEQRTLGNERVDTIRITLDTPPELIAQYAQEGYTEVLECYLVLYKPPEKLGQSHLYLLPIPGVRRRVMYHAVAHSPVGLPHLLPGEVDYFAHTITSFQMLSYTPAAPGSHTLLSTMLIQVLPPCVTCVSLA